MKSFYVCLRKYFTFSGKSTRSEFWSFIIISHIITLALCIPACVLVVQMFISAVNATELGAFMDFVASEPSAIEIQALTEAELNAFAQGFETYFTNFFNGISPLLLMVSLVSMVLLVFACLFFIIPSLSASARRLRDAGFTPWLLLLHLLSVGWIVIGILCLMPTREENA